MEGRGTYPQDVLGKGVGWAYLLNLIGIPFLHCAGVWFEGYPYYWPLVEGLWGMYIIVYALSPVSVWFTFGMGAIFTAFKCLVELDSFLTRTF